MKEEVKKIQNFSIWDSVVNDRIIQYEELEKRYNNKERQIENLTNENGTLSDQNGILLSKIDTLNDEMCEKQKKLEQLEKDNIIVLSSDSNPVTTVYELVEYLNSQQVAG